jgi:hypothetical protein
MQSLRCVVIDFPSRMGPASIKLLFEKPPARAGLDRFLAGSVERKKKLTPSPRRTTVVG